MQDAAGGQGAAVRQPEPLEAGCLQTLLFSSASSNLRSLAFVGHGSDLPCYSVLDGTWDVFDQLSEADISQQGR